MHSSRRRVVVAHALCLLTAFLVWNGVFGLLVSRGEKQYLLDQARHELGLGPEASLPNRMRDTVRNGAGQATRWAVVVYLMGAVSIHVARRRPEDDNAPPADGALLDD